VLTAHLLREAIWPARLSKPGWCAHLLALLTTVLWLSTMAWLATLFQPTSVLPQAMTLCSKEAP
jgi:hypothetical protein